MWLQEAQAAKQHTQGYNLDKRHAFKVNMFDEFDKYSKIIDYYEEPESKEYAPTENLQVPLPLSPILIHSFFVCTAAYLPFPFVCITALLLNNGRAFLSRSS